MSTIVETINVAREVAWLPWAVQYFFLIGLSYGAFLLSLPGVALRKPGCVLVSAVTGEGLGPLLELVEGRLGAGDTVYEVMLRPEDGQGQAWLHDRGEVLSRKTYQDGRVLMKVRLTADKAGQAQARFGTAMKLLGQRKLAAE